MIISTIYTADTTALGHYRRIWLQVCVELNSNTPAANSKVETEKNCQSKTNVGFRKESHKGVGEACQLNLKVVIDDFE